MRRYLVILALVLLLLAACSKAECKTNSDCTLKPANAFTPKCDEEKKCQYTPIPNTVGNGECEEGENSCTAPADCKPPCTGKVPGSTLLEQRCVNKECVQDAASAKPLLVTSEATSAGDKFKIDTEYNQPFNLKKDVLTLTIGLTAASQNKDHIITRAEITAQTKEKRTVTLARKDVAKPLFNGGSIVEEFILDFPADIQAELSNVILTLSYDYNVLTSGKKTPKQSTAKITYREKFTYVNPQTAATCPPPAEVLKKCDDKNPGTRDSCDPTNGFCKHEPIAGACGNFKCDSIENKCTCAQDCGTCTGSAGAYTDYSCRSSQCVTTLKSGVTAESQSIFDDRNLGPVQLNNNFKFNNPYNAKRDKINVDFKIYQQDPSVTRVVIETVRILQGQQQLAEANPNLELSSTPSSVSLQLPAPTEAEEELAPSVNVWYMYVKNDKEERGTFQKPLGKVTVISSD